MPPRAAVIVIFALVLLFSVLFNTLYTFIDIGSPWTSQYTNVTPRVLMAVGGFAGGVLFGTAGIKMLSSKDAKKAYTHTTAAVLRMKESMMKTVTTIQENCSDILASAKDINEQRAEQEGEMLDASETDAENSAEA